VRQRATVSGWVGMPIALGLVLGSILVVDVLNQHLVAGYIALAVLMVALALPFVLFTPDYPLAPRDREPYSWRQVASSYWISPREYPDFGALIAAPVVSLAGYPALFGATAVVAVAASAGVWRIKSVR